jgi:hypothetical protein
MDDRDNRDSGMPKLKLILKTALSLSAGIIWFIFLILWLYFAAERFSVYRNLAIIFLSVLVLCIVNAVVWIPFGIIRRR